VVGPDGSLPLPWLEAPLRQALQTGRAHALLVHGAAGVGQFETAMVLAQTWLCEAPARTEDRCDWACGHCAACRLVQARSHPDLLVLLPEALRASLGWGDADDGDAPAGEKSGKAKPSKDIKIDALRAAVLFAQSTSARGRAKVVVVHPADRMNAFAANSLLKTLEEPPGIARFVLTSGNPQALLPTVRSRCQAVRLDLPDTALASAWLERAGVVRPEVLLAASGGQPLLALEWSQQGLDAALWSRLPELVARGEAAPFAAWPLPRLVDALQKLCHDALCASLKAPTRYFGAAGLPSNASLDRLTAWAKELRQSARSAEHPWNAGLMVEALVAQAQQALRPAPTAGAVRR
jgi:DNA polymerase-3 subunit delta'